ncbi:outer membrane lipoprotein-sorting protein [Thalassotalea mangrovi]|uniref:Outer membrane lipoprotein-sorting protein n=1 Tax=Thalassotalea mangrovi TaxID=2572245 RepID=A0A4U1B3Q7_9GAMM|nr:outer membrane lipoprotein-sorting protein [Thalassotalea mangrovi]TKB44421.1 outer membrane lipoprotein-sorting protein [Thalassotalea mangrovi]
MRIVSLILLLVFCRSTLANPSGIELLKKVDELYRSDTSIAKMSMTISTPDWQRTLQMQSWTRGMQDTFIRVLAPKKDRGVTTLKIDQEMWNYFPKINKVIKVPPSMMMGSWMGSDFTNDDLVRESSLVEDYFVDSEESGDDILLTLTPKKDTVSVWAKITILLQSDSLLPREQAYFNENGDKVRQMTFTNIQQFSGKTIPATMTMVPLNKSGHKTVIEYQQAEFDVDIAEEVFTQRHMMKRF